MTQQKPVGLQNKKTRRTFIEKQLRDYPANKKLIESYHNHSKEATPTLSYLDLGNSVAEQPQKLVELAQQIDKIAWYVQGIDDLLAIASEEEQILLEARYFAPRPQMAWQVANLIYISRTEFYRRRDTLLNWLEKRFGFVVEATDYIGDKAG
jgi:hypothetical protein